MLEGLRGDDTIAELCRREGIAQGVKLSGTIDIAPKISSFAIHTHNLGNQAFALRNLIAYDRQLLSSS